MATPLPLLTENPRIDSSVGIRPLHRSVISATLHLACVAIVASVFGFISTACSKSPTAPTPPSSLAISAYYDPIWLGPRTVGFNHVPLERIRHDSTTNEYVYEFVDSLAGFWSVNLDSGAASRRRVLTRELGQPDVSTDGRWIAFEDGARIFRLPLADGQPDSLGITVIDATQRSFGPRWNPRGDSVCVRRSIGSAGIWILAGDGSATRFVIPGATDADWHPTLNRLVYVTHSGSSAMITQRDQTTGETLGVLTLANTYVERPQYSPDGATIAFLKQPGRQGNLELWAIDASGGEPFRLTPDNVLAGGFAWGPDGAHIVYIKFQSTQHGLSNGTVWMVDFDMRRLSLVAGNP
jgi:Tol biopolymer transport system component